MQTEAPSQANVDRDATSARERLDALMRELELDTAWRQRMFSLVERIVGAMEQLRSRVDGLERRSVAPEPATAPTAEGPASAAATGRVTMEIVMDECVEIRTHGDCISVRVIGEPPLFLAGDHFPDFVGALLAAASTLARDGDERFRKALRRMPVVINDRGAGR